MTDKDSGEWFTPATVIAAEGSRVGIVTCKKCGAAILLDSRGHIDWLSIHRLWHKTQKQRTG